jgi:hypothetical protein
MIRIVCLVNYEDVGCFAVASKPYRKQDNDFLTDRREIPLKWAQQAVKAWINRGGDYLSAPFDGVEDFNLIRA